MGFPGRHSKAASAPFCLLAFLFSSLAAFSVPVSGNEVTFAEDGSYKLVTN